MGLMNGQPVWVKTFGKNTRIAWNEKRRRWETLVNDEVTYILPTGDEPGLPFSNGWMLTSNVGETFTPQYSRSLDILSHKFGPFKTGEPGQFVDIGELVLT